MKDVNGDGFADVIVGAPWAGSAYVYSGKDGTTLGQVDGTEHDGLGWSVAGAGDVNQDGVPDVVVGAPFAGRVPGFDPPGAASVWIYKLTLVEYGMGLPGSGNITPRIGTGGEMPQIGNSTFKIELTEAVGGMFGLIAVSYAPAETPLFGGTLYGDFLTPGQYNFWLVFTTGPFGVPGVGTAAVPIQIPNDPTLIGLATSRREYLSDQRLRHSSRLHKPWVTIPSHRTRPR